MISEIDRKLNYLAKVHQSRQRDNVWAHTCINGSEGTCHFKAHVGVFLHLYATIILIHMA